MGRVILLWTVQFTFSVKLRFFSRSYKIPVIEIWNGFKSIKVWKRIFKKMWTFLRHEVHYKIEAASHFMKLRSFAEWKAGLDWADSYLHNNKNGGNQLAGHMVCSHFVGNSLERLKKAAAEWVVMTRNLGSDGWWVRPHYMHVCVDQTHSSCLFRLMYFSFVLLHFNMHGIT